MYYIYHIPGIKIGCSTNPKRRIKQQGFTQYEIIEKHTDVYKASDREIELQKQNGYRVDAIPYHKAKNIGANGAWNKNRTEKQMQNIIKAQKIGCIIGGKVMGNIMKEKLRVPIAVYRKCDDTFIGEFPSVMDCSRELQLSAPDIFHCLSGKQKSTKGYKIQKIIK